MKVRQDMIISRIKIIALVALLIPGPLSLLHQAQSTGKMFTAELNIKFDGSEQKRFEKAAGLLQEADNQLMEANQRYADLTDLEKKERASSAYSDALKKLFESSETYKEAYNLAYSVFKQKSESFWQKMNRVNHRASGMEKARYYEGTALKSLNRSLIRRKQVMESDRYEYSLEIMEDAIVYEKIAVRDQGRALQICMDYPVEYNYGWEDDKSLEEIVKIMKDPIVHEPPEDIFATVDPEAKVDSAIFKEVIFKVQIAAHTVPLSEEYLNLIYKGEIPIDMIFEEEWYKYSIGRYRTLEEAEATRQLCNIKKAFVVAYSEGKKINTQEAVQLVEQRRVSKR